MMEERVANLTFGIFNPTDCHGQKRTVNMIDKIAETVFEVVSQYPRISGVLFGAMFHPLFGWLIR
jgi:hypothetical protein